MCSMPDCDTVPDDLSGNHGDEEKSDTFPECCSESLEQKNSVSLEQTSCDAGPCKKQRVTTQSPEISHCQSDLPLNNTNNSNYCYHSGWKDEVDNLQNENYHRISKSSSMPDGNSFHNYLPLRGEHFTDRFLRNVLDKNKEIENQSANNESVDSDKCVNILVVRNDTERFVDNELENPPGCENPSTSIECTNSDKCSTKVIESVAGTQHCCIETESGEESKTNIRHCCVEAETGLETETTIRHCCVDAETGMEFGTNIRHCCVEDETGLETETNIRHCCVEAETGLETETNIRHCVEAETGLQTEINTWHCCVEAETGLETETNTRHCCVEAEAGLETETNIRHCVEAETGLQTETYNSNIRHCVEAETGLETETNIRHCCLDADTTLEQNCCPFSSDDQSSSKSKPSVCLKNWHIDNNKSYNGDTVDLRGFCKLLDNNTNCDPGNYFSGSTSTQNRLNCEKINILDVPTTHVKPETSRVHSPCTVSTDVHLTYFSKIPFGILVHILRYLSLSDRLHRVCYVCRQWHEATLDPSLWRRLNLLSQSRLKDGILDMVTSYSDRVLYLDVTDCKEDCFTDAGFISVLNKCRYLRTFKMARYYKFTDETFSHIGMCCPALQHLNLDLCYPCVTDKTMMAIGNGCPHLEYLYLSQCNKISDEGIVAIAHGCPKLKQLRVDQCVKIGDKSLQELGACCPDIEYLHLLSCSLTDHGIQHLSKLLKLRMLDISNIQQLSSKCVEMMVRSCKNLEVLSVSLNRAVDDKCIRVIVEECKSLKRFSCVACNLTDKALEYMGTYSRSLEKIDVAWCGDISDHGVRFISESLVSLEYLGLLKCSQVTMETIDELVEKFPHIHYSNFVLESRKLMRQAQNEGFKIPPIKDL